MFVILSIKNKLSLTICQWKIFKTKIFIYLFQRHFKKNKYTKGKNYFYAGGGVILVGYAKRNRKKPEMAKYNHKTFNK